jgi:flagellin
MAVTINTNVNALFAQRMLVRSGSDVETSLRRLSSGLRINSAKDDAAGLAIADRMTSRLRGLDQAGRTINDGISIAQTAESALGQIGDNFQRIRELAVQAANDTNNASDRRAIQTETDELVKENRRIVEDSRFNGLMLLDGSFKGAIQAGDKVGDLLTFTIPAVFTNEDEDIDMGDHAGATLALEYIDAKLGFLNTERARLGAVQERLSYAYENAASMREHLAESRSRIADTDFASEASSLTRAQILQQAGNAMLAQANSMPNQILQLLRG